MKPKEFVMDEPREWVTGRWCFDITIDHSLIPVIENMPCVEDVMAGFGRSYNVHIDNRYDYEEAWLWIYEQLEIETSEVELSDVWELPTEARK